MTMTLLEQVITFVGGVCAILFGWELYKHLRGDHYHDRNWTPEQYFKHIEDEHPDIHEMYMKKEKDDEPR